VIQRKLDLFDGLFRRLSINKSIHMCPEIGVKLLLQLRLCWVGKTQHRRSIDAIVKAALDLVLSESFFAKLFSTGSLHAFDSDSNYAVFIKLFINC
jgi:hypothetical protein